MWKYCLRLTFSMLAMSAMLCGYTAINKHCPDCHKTNKVGAPLPHLDYIGGPLLSNVVVVDVLWGPSVNPIVSQSMNSFLQDLITSRWIDGLAEYNSAGLPAPTTNQIIGRGVYDSQITITPFNPSTTLTDADIQTEIAAQITAGNLPPPTTDAQGLINSLYVIEFAPGFVISAAGTGTSCVDFCAYHSAFTYQGTNLAYAVQPDFGPGSGCEVGCGDGTELQNQQSVHSHEVAEAITDPEGSFGQSTIGWFDPNTGNEIADICGNMANSEVNVVLNGHPYTVQRLWSNQQNACLAILPPPAVEVAPPLNFRGNVKKNKFLSQTDVINVLKWNASPASTVVNYILFQDGVEIAIVPSQGPFKIILHNRNLKHVYVYTLVAVDENGNSSNPVTVSLP